jgi:hypothetical protein
MTILTKTKLTTYVPGSPGVPGDPGSPAIPSVCTNIVQPSESNPVTPSLKCSWGIDGFGMRRYLCVPYGQDGRTI